MTSIKIEVDGFDVEYCAKLQEYWPAGVKLLINASGNIAGSCA